MKKTYSFLVEKIKQLSRSGFMLIGMDTISMQYMDDTRYMQKVHPYPKGKFLKITYTLAIKTGEFIITGVILHAVFFKFVDKRKKTPDGKFLNCLIDRCEWKNGTRFNRKVEVIKAKKIKGP